MLKEAGFTGEIGIDVSVTSATGLPADADLGRSPSSSFASSRQYLRGLPFANQWIRRFTGDGDWRSEQPSRGARSRGASQPTSIAARHQYGVSLALMWNGRFNAPSGDPFDNSLGFHFPPPENGRRFPRTHLCFRHLLQAQAHIPATEMVEVAGFTGVCRPADLGRTSLFCQFDDGQGEIVPLPDSSGFRNEPIRQTGLELLNKEPEYRQRFRGGFFESRGGQTINFNMFGLAIAEFEFTLTFANGPD